MTQDHLPNRAAADELDAAIRHALLRHDDAAAAMRVRARLAAQSLPPQRRGFLADWWPAALMNATFAPAWPRLAALGCAGMLGLAVGLSGLGTRIASDLDLITVASADDTASNVLDVDSVPVRP
jgi:hypothetical protein